MKEVDGIKLACPDKEGDVSGIIVIGVHSGDVHPTKNVTLHYKMFTNGDRQHRILLCDHLFLKSYRDLIKTRVIRES